MKLCELYEKIDADKVRCLACAHKCTITQNNTGKCGVRKNIKSKLYSMIYGKIVAMNIDPIEKKPLYHFMPGTKTFSIGTVGCNLKCDWCQNYDISQISKKGNILGNDIKPKEIIQAAMKTGCPSISYTYNEPSIYIEFIKDCASIANKECLKNILVTNGYMSLESFNYIKDYIDAMNIDLKSFTQDTYKKYCGCKLNPVLETIKRAYKNKIHIEITTLIVPEINDSEKELEKIAKFIASLDKNIIWHISRFFPMYKMSTKEITPIATLKKAEKIAKKYLNYVYLGNI